MEKGLDFKKILLGAAVGVGMGIALSPRVRERIMAIVQDRAEDLIPTVKKEIELYLKRLSEAIAVGKEAFDKKEDELENILQESRKLD